MEVLEKYKKLISHDYDPVCCEVQNAYELMPNDYLDFAYTDMQGNSNRNHINALSNAKKAMHLQTEILADSFGYRMLKKRRNCPAMLDFLSSCGVVTVSALKDINSARNKVEHDYVIPEIEKLSLYIDVVKMYLNSTGYLLKRFPSNIVFPDTDKEHNEDIKGLFNVALIRGEGKIVLKYAVSDEYYDKAIDITDDAYSSWVQFLVTVSR